MHPRPHLAAPPYPCGTPSPAGYLRSAAEQGCRFTLAYPRGNFPIKNVTCEMNRSVPLSPWAPCALERAAMGGQRRCSSHFPAQGTVSPLPVAVPTLAQITAPSGWADGAEEEKGGISRGSGGGSQGYSPGVRGGISKGANGAITVRLDAGSRGSCLSPPPLLQSAITFAADCRSWRDTLAHAALGMNRVPC